MNDKKLQQLIIYILIHLCNGKSENEHNEDQNYSDSLYNTYLKIASFPSNTSSQNTYKLKIHLKT